MSSKFNHLAAVNLPALLYSPHKPVLPLIISYDLSSLVLRNTPGQQEDFKLFVKHLFFKLLHFLALALVLVTTNKIDLEDEVCQGVRGSHYPRMAETVRSVSEVRFFYVVIYHFQSFLFRMVEMIEKYKEEEPDNEFAELDVSERIETKFIVRKT